MTIIGHTKQWNLLSKSFKEKSFAHAYLFSGQDQLGKKTIAKELIKFANCQERGAPCQECQSCQMIEKEAFPDLLVVRSADSSSSLKDKIDNKEIEIKQIRKVQEFLSYKPYYGIVKSVIIDDAERMNLEAQNCFLKSLEEPKGDTVIFLVTSKPEMLLKTIFSRCQTVKFYPVAIKEIKQSTSKVDKKNAETLADLSLGRPGRAIMLQGDKAKLEREEALSKELVLVINADLARKFQYVKALDLETANVHDILDSVQKYLRYVLFSKIGFETSKEQEYFFEQSKTKNYSVSQLTKAINLTQDISSTLTFTNANAKMALEVLLMEI